jgi:hypothetical protein
VSDTLNVGVDERGNGEEMNKLKVDFSKGI